MVGSGYLCLLFNQITGFFDQQYHERETSDIFVFYMKVIIIRLHLRLPLPLGVVRCVSGLIILLVYLNNNISGRSQLVLLSDQNCRLKKITKQYLGIFQIFEDIACYIRHKYYQSTFSFLRSVENWFHITMAHQTGAGY